MKKVIAELNAAATYDEQYAYLYRVTEDLTFDNLLDLLVLIERDIHETTDEKESMLAIVKSELQYLYNEK